MTGGSVHCIAGGARPGRGWGQAAKLTVRGHRVRSGGSLTRVFVPAAAAPPGCGLSRVRLLCPSSSRPPCLLFLGLSLGIFWATTVRGCLAESPHALQSTCQLQQQGNELKGEGEGECEREARGLPSRCTRGLPISTAPVWGTITTRRQAGGGGWGGPRFRTRQASALERVSRDGWLSE